MFGSTGTSVAQEYDGAASCLPCSSSTTANTALARCFFAFRWFYKTCRQ